MVYGYQPEIDASLGLIFRLNDLWAKADRRALSGNLDAWELVLDRVFSNLLYREEIVIKENGKEGVIDITLSEKDKKIWEVIKKKIRISKLGVGESIKNKDMSKLKNSKEKHYQAIMIYDIWLRKYMQQELKLYLRESSSNPGSALFGGAFRKKT